MPLLNAQITARASIAVIDDVVYDVARVAPAVDYWAFSSYSVVLREVLSALGDMAAPEPAFVGPLWGYLDAAAAVVIGLHQLQDKHAHRPIMNQLKASLNLLNGIQLGALASLSIASLGPISLAVSFGLGFGMSMDESIRCQRRLDDEHYWLEDSLALLIKNAAQVEHLEVEIERLQQAKASASKMVQWSLAKKKERLAHLKNEQVELLADVLTRAKSILEKDPTKKALLGSYVKKTAKILPQFSSTLQSILDMDPETLKAECSSLNHQQADQNIKAKARLALSKAVMANFIWGMAFLGAVLSCIPGLQLAGVAVMGVASLLYLSKHLVSLYSKSHSSKVTAEAKDEDTGDGDGEGEQADKGFHA